MFFTLLATLYFHFVHVFVLLHVSSNRLITSSFDRRRGLSSRCFLSFIYQSTTSRPPIWSVNFETCSIQKNFYFRYTTITFFTPFRSRITSLRICSRNHIPSKDLSIELFVITGLCSSFFMVAHVPLVYIHT